MKDAYESTRHTIQKIELTAKMVNASLTDMIWTRIFTTNIWEWKQIEKINLKFQNQKLSLIINSFASTNSKLCYVCEWFLAWLERYCGSLGCGVKVMVAFIQIWRERDSRSLWILFRLLPEIAPYCAIRPD